jgi:hypothetical protein
VLGYVTKDISFCYTYTLSRMEFKVNISNTSDSSSQTTIYSPDCLYTLQQAPYMVTMNETTCKIVQLPYQYADNSSIISTWTEVLDELKEKKEIISYTFIPDQQPTTIIVEYPPSSSSSTSIG